MVGVLIQKDAIPKWLFKLDLQGIQALLGAVQRSGESLYPDLDGAIGLPLMPDARRSIAGLYNKREPVRPVLLWVRLQDTYGAAPSAAAQVVPDQEQRRSRHQGRDQERQQYRDFGFHADYLRISLWIRTVY